MIPKFPVLCQVRTRIWGKHGALWLRADYFPDNGTSWSVFISSELQAQEPRLENGSCSRVALTSSQSRKHQLKGDRWCLPQRALRRHVTQYEQRFEDVRLACLTYLRCETLHTHSRNSRCSMTGATWREGINPSKSLTKEHQQTVVPLPASHLSLCLSLSRQLLTALPLTASKR